MTNDLINGGFELVGAFFIFMNVRQILRDKTVKGVYWPATAFFAAWGLWNLFYYPSLDQWISFSAGILIFGFNLVWIWLTIYYLYINPPKV